MCSLKQEINMSETSHSCSPFRRRWTLLEGLKWDENNFKWNMQSHVLIFNVPFFPSPPQQHNVPAPFSALILISVTFFHDTVQQPPKIHWINRTLKPQRKQSCQKKGKRKKKQKKNNSGFFLVTFINGLSYFSCDHHLNLFPICTTEGVNDGFICTSQLRQLCWLILSKWHLITSAQQL